MKAKQNKLQLKTKPLFKFGQEVKHSYLSTDPTITVTGTQSTITTFVMKR